MTAQTLAGYSVAAWLAILSPGPAVLLAVRTGVVSGLSAVMWSSFGNIAGVFCVSAGTTLGLGALLKTSSLAFEALKTLGAFYLFYLGLLAIRSRGSAFSRLREAHAGADTRGAGALFREAFTVAVLNPKLILFFSALFPQFLNRDSPMLQQFVVLTAIFMVLSFATLVGYAAVASRAGSVLVQPVFARWTSRITGAAFVVFGVYMLMLRRPAA